MIIEVIFWFVVFYVLMRFVFGFVVPLISTGKQIRTKMKDAQQHMHDFQSSNNAQTNNSNTTKQPNNSTTSMGEYIDFEEIK